MQMNPTGNGAPVSVLQTSSIPQNITQNIEANPFVVEAPSTTHLIPFDPFESIALNQPNFNANFDDFEFLAAPKTLQVR
jgi:hypothetical protein